jgi:hypothetical protein
VIQVKFENLEIHMPYDKFEPVISTTSENLYENIQKILSNDKEREDLEKKGEFFIKKCYNIPETNPKSVLDKLIIG